MIIDTNKHISHMYGIPPYGPPKNLKKKKKDADLNRLRAGHYLKLTFTKADLNSSRDDIFIRILIHITSDS